MPEVITRRHLPHWYVPGAAHFVTYRLAGTLPDHLLEQFRAEHESRLAAPTPDGQSQAQHLERVHKQAFARLDRYLDLHRDIDWLARPTVAALIRRSLYHYDATRYYLMAWCVMPNHVHLLFQPIERSEAPENVDYERPDPGGPLARIMHSLKSYTASEANKILGRNGPFWQHESYDHWVRDEGELERVVDYIAYNPVKAGLVTEPQDWFFCSAHDRFLLDGALSGWLPPDES